MSQQEAKNFYKTVKDEREILRRTIRDIIQDRALKKEELVSVRQVPLLSVGTTLEVITQDEVGKVLFELTGEQVICRCENGDTENIPIYTNVFVIEPGDEHDFPIVIRGSTMQMTINNYLTQTSNVQQTISSISNLQSIQNLQILKGTIQTPVTGFNVYAVAGDATLITIPLQASGNIIHIADLAISGDVAGYGWIEYAGTVHWGRLNWPANSGWAQQLRGDWQITSDGTNQVLIRAHLNAAGRADASLLYSIE